MKKNIFTAALTILLLAPLAGAAQEQPHIDLNTTVEREVTPDEIFLRITVNENDYKGKKSLEQMQDEMLAALKANGIDIAEALSINYMGSEVSYKLFSKEVKPKTEAIYTLKLNDAATMQKVIASLEEKQITNIVLSRMRYSKEEELKKSMSVSAMQQAQAEARTLAGAIGQEIGKATSISYWMSKGEEVQPRLYKARTASADAINAAGNEPTQININKLTYKVTVNVKFELK